MCWTVAFTQKLQIRYVVEYEWPAERRPVTHYRQQKCPDYSGKNYCPALPPFG
jgi:hypothetical protein